MKTALIVLLALLTTTYTISALTLSVAPNVCIAAKIIVRTPAGGQRALCMADAITPSGQYVQYDCGTQCEITPTLLPNGQVVVHAVLTVHQDKAADQITEVQMTTQVGQVAEFKAGDVGFAVTMTPHQ